MQSASKCWAPSRHNAHPTFRGKRVMSLSKQATSNAEGLKTLGAECVINKSFGDPVSAPSFWRTSLAVYGDKEHHLQGDYLWHCFYFHLLSLCMCEWRSEELALLLTPCFRGICVIMRREHHIWLCKWILGTDLRSSGMYEWVVFVLFYPLIHLPSLYHFGA